MMPAPASVGRGGPQPGAQSLAWHPWVLLSKPTFPRGVRPQLSLAAGVTAAPAAKEGHKAAETGAGARAPAGAGTGAATAAPHRANQCFGVSSEGAAEPLFSPPCYGSRLSTFIWH